MSSQSSQQSERQPFAQIDNNSVSIQMDLSGSSKIVSLGTPFPSIEIPSSPIRDAQTPRVWMKGASIQSSIGGNGSNAISFASTSSTLASISNTNTSWASTSATPTLGSALGINTSALSSASTSSITPTNVNIPRKTSRSKQSNHTNSIHPPVWARRPSLPTMPSMGNRMSIASISSFDSLPEGETVPRFSASPLGKNKQDLYESSEGDETRKDMSSEMELASPIISSSTPSTSTSTMEDLKKRKNLAMELLTTEHAYLGSLRLINENYYQPLAALSRGVASNKVESLSTAAPILSRKAISEIFSNFVDILHLNMELLSRLDDRLSGRSRNTPSSRPASMANTSSTSESPKTEDEVKPWDAKNDSIGDLLVPMAPFLKMYSLFVKNFSSALTRIETERKANESFAKFLRETEKATWGRASNQGGFGYGLGFQAHLLTIVQRIPRYKLLVGDLVRCTPKSHRDYFDLCKAYAVIEKVAESINDNIRQHEVVVAMLGLQRSLVGLSEPLIIPGRSLIKRGTLLKACRKNIQSREFFLFSDCFVYAAPISGSIDAASAAWQALSRYGSTDALVTSPVASGAASPKFPDRPNYTSMGSSENIRIRTRTMSGPSPYDSKRTSMALDGQQQLQFRGKFSLQDCTVVAVDDVVAPESWLRHCLEIRTPGKSFAVYAETLEVKVEWLTAIRNAREEWVSNRRTLQAEEDSIQAKRDRRRSLQVGVISQRPIATTRNSSMVLDSPSASSIPEFKGPEKVSGVLPRSSSSVSISLYRIDSYSQALSASTSYKSKPLKVLEEYNAPVWVPDSRADRCACCNEQFGIWRRKHHCRLCGQVVCWSCSSKTFLIASYEEGEEDRPARSCDVCYESVFPDAPEPGTSSLPLTFTEMDQRRPSTGRPDSEVSLNIPSTPTSPSSNDEHFQLHSDHVENTAAHQDIDEKLSALTIAAPSPFLPRRIFNNKMGVNFRKARGTADLQLFPPGSLLSPQIQAATSGAGTFRLVTPRLTTPEGEQSSATTTSSSSSGPKYAGANPSSGSNANGGGIMDDYFTGAEPGQSELIANNQMPRLKRKKPLSAAARLSSVYGGLTSQSLHNES